MSSTNRGATRHGADYYVTPIKHVNAFLDAWLGDLQHEDNPLAERPDRFRWLDPCAGGDEKHPMSYPTALEQVGVYPDTIDIREDSLAQVKCDYLSTEHAGEYDVIITNPPFDRAIDIITKALDGVKQGGYVVMLLRLNFLGSKGRRKFFEENMPERIYVHHERMSFKEDGGTDSIEYAHFIWCKGYKVKFSQLTII